MVLKMSQLYHMNRRTRGGVPISIRSAACTGQRINELENGPSSYQLKMQFFGLNRVGFDVVKDLV